MRLLVPALRPRSSRLRSREPAEMKAARQRSRRADGSGWWWTGLLRTGFLRLGCLRIYVPRGTCLCTVRYILAWGGSGYEDAGMPGAAWAGVGDLGFGDGFLWARGTAGAGDDGGAVLDQLCDFAGFV